MSGRVYRGKHHCFTINGELAEVLERAEGFDASTIPDLAKMVFQVESGEDTGNVHIQGYCVFTKTKRRTTVQNLEFFLGAHLEKRKGTAEQAIHYCEKPVDDCTCKHCRKASPPIMEPTWWPSEEEVKAGNQQGKRTDLDAVATMVNEGATDYEIGQAHPATFMRYHRGIGALRNTLPAVPQPERPIDCIIYWGPSRTGKSSRLRAECADPDEWYWVMNPQGGTAWFDGYQGQPGLVLDEMSSSWFTWTTIKQLLDNASPLRVQTKGGSVLMTAHKFRMSSNTHPKFWYSGMKGKPNSPWKESPLRFRFSEIIYMGERLAPSIAGGPIDEDEPMDEHAYPLVRSRSRSHLRHPTAAELEAREQASDPFPITLRVVESSDDSSECVDAPLRKRVTLISDDEDDDLFDLVYPEEDPNMDMSDSSESFFASL